MFTLKWKLLTENTLFRKNYGDKKGSKSFQQQRKMFCRKFGWPSIKVLQIKVHRLKLFGCSLKLLTNVQCTSTGKRRVTDTGYLFHRFGEEGAQVFKKSLQSLLCILHPACSLYFTLSLQFTPGPQSAFYTDRISIKLLVDNTIGFHNPYSLGTDLSGA